MTLFDGRTSWSIVDRDSLYSTQVVACSCNVYMIGKQNNSLELNHEWFIGVQEISSLEEQRYTDI